MRRYHRKEWQQYRQQVIDLDGGKCVRCGRGPAEGAILQVHHKEYHEGRFPWEYPPEACETLCKGCHAGEHGLIRPFNDWECVGADDLGDLTGECDLCGTSIRYVFLVHHAKWPSMEVGEVCCNHLTQTTAASNYMEEERRYDSRQQTFVNSSRWIAVEQGGEQIVQNGATLAIRPTANEYRIFANDYGGRLRFPSVRAAKQLAFEVLHNGKLEDFLEKLRKVREMRPGYGG